MDLLREEKKLKKKGFRLIAGIDEVGRGPLAGPVTACALVVLKNKFRIPKALKGIDDSKKLTAKKRENYYNLLKDYSCMKWGIGRASERVIDRINILEATKLAMQRAVSNLEKKIDKKIDFLIIDGNFKINSSISQKSISKADQKVFSVMAASIIAKVKRDKAMQRLHKKYPDYCFNSNKGYPTKVHFALLRKKGPSKVHRKSFYPVSSY